MASSWIEGADGSGFGAGNLPLGIFTTSTSQIRRTGVAIGPYLLDLVALTGDPRHATGTLNAFLARGRQAWTALRAQLVEFVTEPAHREAVEPHLVPRAEATMHLPIEVADYVDFYSSQHHAENLGRILRPGQPPLTPNWRHLPIGYHGRAGTVRVSGTPVTRPSGQRKGPDETAPTFGPSRRLDIEAELGFVVGAPSDRPVPVDAFAEHVFGVCLVNDWSARDLQAWENVPLGPFLGKSFLTSMSPWVVPLDALAAARVAPPSRDPQPLPYLHDADDWGLDITMTVAVNGQIVSRPPCAELYWTGAQQLAHMTVNGATLRTGDLYASGTVSGPEPGQYGSLIELSENGAQPLTLPDGATRSFLEDGDQVIISATAPGPDGSVIDLGAVSGRVARR